MAMAADNAPDTTSLPPVERQLRVLESQVDAYYSGQEDFNKGAADLESKPSLKKLACASLKDVMTKTLRELRSNAAQLESQLADMSEDQRARFSVCRSRLEKASPALPACAGG